MDFDSTYVKIDLDTIAANFDAVRQKTGVHHVPGGFHKSVKTVLHHRIDTQCGVGSLVKRTAQHVEALVLEHFGGLDQSLGDVILPIGY